MRRACRETFALFPNFKAPSCWGAVTRCLLWVHVVPHGLLQSSHANCCLIHRDTHRWEDRGGSSGTPSSGLPWGPGSGHVIILSGVTTDMSLIVSSMLGPAFWMFRWICLKLSPWGCSSQSTVYLPSCSSSTVETWNLCPWRSVPPATLMFL